MREQKKNRNEIDWRKATKIQLRTSKWPRIRKRIARKYELQHRDIIRNRTNTRKQHRDVNQKQQKQSEEQKHSEQQHRDIIRNNRNNRTNRKICCTRKPSPRQSDTWRTNPATTYLQQECLSQEVRDNSRKTTCRNMTYYQRRMRTSDTKARTKKRKDRLTDNDYAGMNAAVKQSVRYQSSPDQNGRSSREHSRCNTSWWGWKVTFTMNQIRGATSRSRTRI